MKTNRNGDMQVAICPDARQGKMSSTKRTLGAAGSILSLAVPEWAVGVELLTASDGVRWAMNEDPAAESTTDLATGAPMWPGQLTSRLLESGAGRTLRIRALAGGEVVQVAFF